MTVDLGHAVLQASEDPVETDLVLVCELCESVVCTAQHSDTLEVLVLMYQDHACVRGA